MVFVAGFQSQVSMYGNLFFSRGAIVSFLWTLPPTKGVFTSNVACVTAREAQAASVIIMQLKTSRHHRWEDASSHQLGDINRVTDACDCGFWGGGIVFRIFVCSVSLHPSQLIICPFLFLFSQAATESFAQPRRGNEAEKCWTNYRCITLSCRLWSLLV